MEKNAIWILLVIVFITALIQRYISYSRYKSKDDIDNSHNKNHYIKKKLLTDNELFFYNCFKQLDSKYIILPQISLSSIIKKTDYHKYQNELNRILDFAIFDQNYNILLAIEINDDSHKLKKRKYRDKKLKEILKLANIELLTYNINYQNTQESVIRRTTETLEKTQ